MIIEAVEKIGERVKSFRKERGMSQDDLAEGICSRQIISLLENGQHLPSAMIMQKIAERLGMPLQEIVVDQMSELETKVQLDIVKIHVETGEYERAISLIEEMEKREDLLVHQKRDLVLCLSESLIRTGNVDQAVKLLTDLQQTLEQQRETDDHLLATVYDKLGTAYYFLSNITNAHAHYLRAHQLTQRFDEFDLTAARISYNLGMTCQQLNRNTDAFNYLSSAKTYFENISDIKRLAQTLFELGIACRFNQDYELASRYLQESLSLYQSQNLLNVARWVRESYAYIVLSINEPDRAIAELLSCAIEFEKDGDIVQLVYTYARASKLLLAQKKVQEAGEYLQKALALFSSEDAPTSFKYVTAHQVYAEYLLEVKQLDKCVEFSFNASELFGKMGYVRDAADSLSPAVKAYREMGLFEKALEVSEKTVDLLRQSSNHQ